MILGVLAHELAHNIHNDAFAPAWEGIDRELHAHYIAEQVVAKVGIASDDVEQAPLDMRSSCSISASARSETCSRD